MLSIAGTFGVVRCFGFVLVFKSTAVQTLHFLFVLFLFLSLCVAISLPIQQFCRARGESCSPL